MNDPNFVFTGEANNHRASRSSISPIPSIPVTNSTIPPSQSYYNIEEQDASPRPDECTRLLGNPPPTIWTRFTNRYKFGKLILVVAGLLGVFIVMFVVLGTLHVFQNRNYQGVVPGVSVGETKYDGKSWGVATETEFTLGGEGDGTYYDPGVGITACGTSFTASDMIVALNHVDYGNYPNPNDSPVCGHCIKVTGPLGAAKATIQDMCPGCGRGSLDLSPAVFSQVGNLVDGRIFVTWEAC